MCTLVEPVLRPLFQFILAWFENCHPNFNYCPSLMTASKGPFQSSHCIVETEKRRHSNWVPQRSIERELDP